MGTEWDMNIDTVVEAEQRGEAYLREAEIGAEDGTILVPVNCGQQLYDVVDITEAKAGLNTQEKRVVGLVIIYDTRRGKYEERLSLGAV